MRAALALAGLLATTSLVGLGTAAPAQATGCHAHSHGVTISHIERHEGLTCDDAKKVIHSAMTGHPTLHSIGWTCSHYGSHHIPYSCWENRGHKWVTFFVVVGDGTG